MQDSTFVTICIIIFPMKEYALFKNNDCRLITLFISYEKEAMSPVETLQSLLQWGSSEDSPIRAEVPLPWGPHAH